MGLFDRIKSRINEMVSVETKTTRTPYGKKHFYAKIQFGLPALDIEKVIAEQTIPEWVVPLQTIGDRVVECDFVHTGADHLLVRNLVGEMDCTRRGELTINHLHGYGDNTSVPSELYEGHNTKGYPAHAVFIGLKKLHIKSADIDSIYIEQVDEVILDVVSTTHLTIVDCAKVAIDYLNSPHLVYECCENITVNDRCGMTRESAVGTINETISHLEGETDKKQQKDAHTMSETSVWKGLHDQLHSTGIISAGLVPDENN